MRNMNHEVRRASRGERKEYKRRKNGEQEREETGGRKHTGEVEGKYEETKTKKASFTPCRHMFSMIQM